MKKLAGVGIIAVLFANTSPTLAGQVDSLNVFAAGERAVADEVNANFSSVKTAVDDNDGRITQNSTDIQTNSGIIANNDTRITDTQASVNANADAITATTGSITEIRNDIDANAEKITANETAIAENTASITELQAGIGGCPEGMASVGPLCFDIYEASVVDQSGNAVDKSACGENGNDCKDVIFARSEADKAPAEAFTWFQAQQACANSGKRLPTSAEWQMAVAGTVDPGENDGISNTSCNTSSATVRSTGLAGTVAGGADSCISSWGAEDMIGNVEEWVADWVQGGTDTWNPNSGTAGDVYNGDALNGANPASFQGNGQNFPAAVLRGGSVSHGTIAGAFYYVSIVAPSVSSDRIGFRCVK